MIGCMDSTWEDCRIVHASAKVKGGLRLRQEPHQGWPLHQHRWSDQAVALSKGLSDDCDHEVAEDRSLRKPGQVGSWGLDGASTWRLSL
jgi:hypothetical protein